MTGTECSAPLIAQAVGLDSKYTSALWVGIDDGLEQGLELTSGMSYDDLEAQWAYDLGTYVGACLKLRNKPC